MRGSILRGLAEAASVAANLTKIAVEAASPSAGNSTQHAASSAAAAAAASASRQQRHQQPRPWSTQRHAASSTAPHPAEEALGQRDIEERVNALAQTSTEAQATRPAPPPPPPPSSTPAPSAPANTSTESVKIERAASTAGSSASAIAAAPFTEPKPTPTSAGKQDSPSFGSDPPQAQAVAAPAAAPTPARNPAQAPPQASEAKQPASVQSQPAAAQAPREAKPPSRAAPAFDPATTTDEYDPENAPRVAPLRAAKVPSSRLGRLMHYGSLGAGLAWGAAGQYLSGSSAKGNAFMGESNLRRLVDKLSTMRGAALKMGQFMSIQDSNMLPPELEEVLLRVQNSANYMPEWQMEKVMTEDLGPDWRSNFDHFNNVPFAAASIGQVHSATLSSSHPSPLAGKKVAIKIQFPGIKQSIASDLSYLTTLLTASALLPRGLFLDSTIRTMRGELEDECDYAREAEMGRRFARLLDESQSKPSQVEGVISFAVPRVVDELCTGRVLTTEMMRGRPLTQASRYDQRRRNEIATSILRLCLQELFHFRLMQTDPNWSNFLLNERTETLELLDFGATREYSPEFIDNWYALLSAAVRGDREACIEWSGKIGYLTGEESEAMLDAHVSSMLLLAEPFAASSPSPYPFTNQTITARVRSHIPLMLRERKTPPPKETYSLNRKLSGAFLLCARLGADVPCREVWEEVAGSYRPLASAATTTTAAASPSGTRGLHTLARSSSPAPYTKASRDVRPGIPSPILSNSRIRTRLAGGSAAYSTLVAVESRAGTVDGGCDGRPVRSASLLAVIGQAEVVDRSKQRVWCSRVVNLLDAHTRRLDLRSQWSHRSNGVSVENLAKLELPADPLGVNSSRPEETTPLAPVLGPKQEAEDKMKVALGKEDEQAGANAGPKPVLLRGVLVPRKPPPPGPEDCCMSGCAHCTYDIYADAIQEYLSELAAARDALLELDPTLTEGEWATASELGVKRLANDADAGQSRGGSNAAADADAAEREVDEAVRNVEDPTLRAFLDFERKMKKKQKEREREQQKQQQQAPQ